MLRKTLIGFLLTAALTLAADTAGQVRDSRLADAAERGDRQAIASLITQKADVNTPRVRAPPPSTGPRNVTTWKRRRCCSPPART